jgi:hypothetical protein
LALFSVFVFSLDLEKIGSNFACPLDFHEISPLLDLALDGEITAQYKYSFFLFRIAPLLSSR